MTDAASGIVGRGVLIDAPALTGRRWLEPGEGVFPEHLDHACARQGRDGRLRATSSSCTPALRAAAGRPGLETSDDRKRATRDGMPPASRGYTNTVAAIGADTAERCRDHRVTTRCPIPIHYVGIVAMGLWLIDNCDLTELASTCDRLQRWTFEFIVAGLRLRGGTGSPVNPIALL